MAWLGLGFRPFYTFAIVMAVVALVIWLSMLFGGASAGQHLHGTFWHAHEMVFGFTTAVVTGFLLTAVRNWTGQPMPTGRWLGAMALLWFLPRVLIVSGPYSLAVALDCLFLFVLTLVIAIPIVRLRSVRNYKIVALVALLAIVHLAFHYEGPNRQASIAAIDVILVLMSIVGGRIIVAFTANAISDASPRLSMPLEFVVFASTLGAMLIRHVSASGSAVGQPPLIAAMFALAGLSHWLRLTLWQPHKTFANALLWMLPVAYAWIPLALLMRAAGLMQWLAETAWLHAMTMGAISSLMMAMIIRSTLGHTGRALLAHRLDIAAFLTLQIAVVVRLLGALGLFEHAAAAIKLAGGLWILAFVLLGLRFIPMLVSPRADGKPG